MEIAGLLEDDLPGAGGGVEDGEVAEARQRLDLFRLAVEREQVELSVPVGEEIHLIPQPHRFDVIRAALGLGDFFDRIIAHLEDPNFRNPAAPVVLPLSEGILKRVIGDILPVRRKRRPVDRRDLEFLGKSALDGNAVKLETPGRRHAAGRYKIDRSPLGRKSLDEVNAGMPGQALRDAALGRHDINIQVPFVLSAEGDPFPVGRKGGAVFDADIGRELPRASAVEVGHPKVIGIDKGNSRLADRRLGQKARVLRVYPGRRLRKNGEPKNKDERTQNSRRFLKHVSSVLDQTHSLR